MKPKRKTLAQLRPGKDTPEWFFMWVYGAPYITTICAWSRSQLIGMAVKEQGLTWKQIYDRGGRVIKCRVTPLAARMKERK